MFKNNFVKLPDPDLAQLPTNILHFDIQSANIVVYQSVKTAGCHDL